ncbi:hypothetical protein HHS_07660 [Candidatus Pantoea carbekii]|uniref:Endoribonuclease YbeY n=1 Tax=Candidatus Pantoea carbekii TaxID=1235990 RepID=U3U3J3_9GAMM|nr:hypothetical protein HHS_07660 [Candidatus Pantoea carbekii]
MIILDLQLVCSNVNNLPNIIKFQYWLELVAKLFKVKGEVTVRIVDEEESQTLNFLYRGINKPTNVLSFPFESSPYIQIPLLGDLIICSSIVKCQAFENNKRNEEYWAHIVIHGMLHLLGYKHFKKKQAKKMERLEIKIMHMLGYSNPYLFD